jgi:hypothetical protein
MRDHKNIVFARSTLKFCFVGRWCAALASLTADERIKHQRDVWIGGRMRRILCKIGRFLTERAWIGVSTGGQQL